MGDTEVLRQYWGLSLCRDPHRSENGSGGS